MLVILNDIFLYGSLFMGVIPLGMALYNVAFLNPQHKWVMGKIIFHLLIVCISVFVRFSIPNFFLNYILCAGLAITIYFIFIDYFTNLKLKIIFSISTYLYVVFLLIDAFVLSGINTYKNFSFTLFSFWALTVIFIYLGQIFRNMNIRSLRDYPMFWITIGMGITYSTSLLHFFLASSSLFTNLKLFFLTENITLMGNVAGTMLQTIGFWKCRNNFAVNEILFKEF